MSVSQNASLAENIKASPNFSRDLNIVSFLTFGFVEKPLKK